MGDKSDSDSPSSKFDELPERAEAVHHSHLPADLQLDSERMRAIHFPPSRRLWPDALFDGIHGG